MTTTKVVMKMVAVAAYRQWKGFSEVRACGSRDRAELVCRINTAA